MPSVDALGSTTQTVDRVPPTRSKGPACAHSSRTRSCIATLVALAAVPAGAQARTHPCNDDVRRPRSDHDPGHHTAAEQLLRPGGRPGQRSEERLPRDATLSPTSTTPGQPLPQRCTADDDNTQRLCERRAALRARRVWCDSIRRIDNTVWFARRHDVDRADGRHGRPGERRRPDPWSSSPRTTRRDQPDFGSGLCSTIADDRVTPERSSRPCGGSRAYARHGGGRSRTRRHWPATSTVSASASIPDRDLDGTPRQRATAARPRRRPAWPRRLPRHRRRRRPSNMTTAARRSRSGSSPGRLSRLGRRRDRRQERQVPAREQPRARPTGTPTAAPTTSRSRTSATHHRRRSSSTTRSWASEFTKLKFRSKAPRARRSRSAASRGRHCKLRKKGSLREAAALGQLQEEEDQDHDQGDQEGLRRQGLHAQRRHTRRCVAAAGT